MHMKSLASRRNTLLKLPLPLSATLLVVAFPVASFGGEGPVPLATQDRDPIAALNHHLSEWVSFSGEARMRAEGTLNNGFYKDSSSSDVGTRFRLNMDAHPGSTFRLFVQGQDAHRINVENSPANADLLELNQAFFEIRSKGESSAKLRAGRQEVFYGGQRLIGDSGWPNNGCMFDGARLDIGGAIANASFFAISPVEVRATQFNRRVAGEDIFGVYGSLSPSFFPMKVEPYLIVHKLGNLGGSTGLPGAAEVYTPGARVVITAPYGFGLIVEGADQQGRHSGIPVSAFGTYLSLSYKPAHAAGQPTLSTEYGYASGNDGTGRHYGTFDSFHPGAHGLYGITDLVGWRNIRHVRFSAAANLTKALSIDVDIHILRLASTHDGLYAASNVEIVPVSAAGVISSHVGIESDAVFKWGLSPAVHLEGGIGHLAGGRFLKENSPGRDVTYPYTSVHYDF